MSMGRISEYRLARANQAGARDEPAAIPLVLAKYRYSIGGQISILVILRYLLVSICGTNEKNVLYTKRANFLKNDIYAYIYAQGKDLIVTHIQSKNNHILEINEQLMLPVIVSCQGNNTGDPLHSRAACTQPCNVNTHSRAHCSPGARLCEQWGHGCVNNGARLCASARLCRGSPVNNMTAR